MSKDVLCRTSEMPYTPADHVLRGLAKIRGGDLRLRWSAENNKWAVEMKAYRPMHTTEISQEAHYKTLPNGREVERDSWLRQRDGYITLGYWDAHPVLGDWCVSELNRNDIARLGGHRKIAQMLEDQEENRRAAIERRHSDERIGIGEEIYNDWQWRQGEKSIVPRNYKG